MTNERVSDERLADFDVGPPSDGPSLEEVQSMARELQSLRRSVPAGTGEVTEARSVYIASKLAHAQRWIDLRAQRSDIIFTAHWPDHVVGGLADTKDNAEQFWLEDEADIRRASALIVVAEEGEHLRGALIEAGIAIALGKTVVVVGLHPDYGTWQFHPSVLHAGDVDSALTAALAKEPKL